MKSRVAILAMLCVMYSAAAKSSELGFSFNLPSFGGNGLASSYYISLMESQKRPQEDEEPEKTALESFKEDLERRLLSTLASDIVNQIFGETAAESGSFTVGTLDVLFDTVDGDVVITLTDGVTTTEVIVPGI